MRTKQAIETVVREEIDEYRCGTTDSDGSIWIARYTPVTAKLLNRLSLDEEQRPVAEGVMKTFAADFTEYTSKSANIRVEMNAIKEANPAEES